MVRISKLTDYSIVVMAYFMTTPGLIHNARDLVAETQLQLPTISKLLKMLTKGQLLKSHRGTKGGYSLATDPATLTLADIVAIMEGKFALTECSLHPGHCAIESVCQLKSQWPSVSNLVYQSLKQIRLIDMLKGESHGLC